MANCVTCKARCESAGQHRVKTDCISYIPKDYPKPMTNADRIRAMTDEELADVFDHVQGDAYLVGIGQRKNSVYPGAGISWLDWLKEEVDT